LADSNFQLLELGERRVNTLQVSSGLMLKKSLMICATPSKHATAFLGASEGEEFRR
jgi:hypothetical protein